MDAEALRPNLGDHGGEVHALPGRKGTTRRRSAKPLAIMAMAPGTVEDLQHIKDLKGSQDTGRTPGDGPLRQPVMAKSVSPA